MFNVLGSRLGSHRLTITGFLVLAIYLLPFMFRLSFAEEYKFEASEFEKKPYHIGGYIEFYPVFFRS